MPALLSWAPEVCVSRVLIIDDDSAVRSAVRMILKYEQHEVEEAASGAEAMRALDGQGPFDIALCDVKMPGMDGLELLPRLRERAPGLIVIMISGHGTLETAVAATRLGAFDFLEKPLDRDRLLLTIRNAQTSRRLAAENESLRTRIAERYAIVGSSPVMRELCATIARVAASDARVLITGENGTGKELVARNLHLLSPRRDGPWVEVNCAAIPHELIESELFGHEKGSFTGADSRKIGRFEQAHRGTLFLDEVGDMPLSAQAKVLRVLEESVVQRVGGSTPSPVDVRVVAATNKDLEKEVAEGRFREDLYYRLNVIPLVVPPLRERGDDVVELFTRFLVGLCAKYQRPTMRLSGDAALALKAQPWPGNVRELRNLAERVALLVPEAEVGAAALENLGQRTSRSLGDASLFAIPNFEEFKDTAERLYLEHKLRENGYNIKRTAELLGMQRSNLYKKIERYGLKTSDS
jgi:two-component system nitrogen regulation response regulator NtrX